MDCRLINQETIKQVADLWDCCFEKKDSKFFQWYFQEYVLKHNKIVGGFENQKLTTMVHLNPYVLNLHGHNLKVKYLVGVATDPVARGQHKMGELLATTFNLLRAAGNKVALLEPINAGIYLPYGFAYTFFRLKYAMPLAGLTIPYVDFDLQIERVQTSQAENLLAPIYQQVMTRYDSYIVRDSFNWQALLQVAEQEDVTTVVVKEGPTVLGYLLYRMEGEQVIVQELLAVNDAAQRRLLAYLKALNNTFKTLEWLSTPDDLTYLYFKDQDYAPKVEPFMMARVINAGKILEELTVPVEYQGQELIVYLKDDFMNLNNLYTKVVFTKDGVELRDTLKEPNVTMDISTFTQLYFGTYDARQLYQQGRILAEDTKHITMLAKLFPRGNNFINEYF